MEHHFAGPLRVVTGEGLPFSRVQRVRVRPVR